MKRRNLVPLTLALASLLVLSVVAAGVGFQRPQTGPRLVARGSLLVSGPIEATRRMKTAAGFRFSSSLEAQKIQLVKLEYDARVSGKELDPNSPAIRKLVEETIQSTGWVIDDNSRQVENQIKARARRQGVKIEDVAKPDVTLNARSTVKERSVSFSFSGQGSMGFRELPPQARERKLVEGDKGEGEGLIRNFRSTVEELRPLNGSNIRVKIKFHVDQVDMSGVARGRVEFELRSDK
jgi:hypothetical protein